MARCIYPVYLPKRDIEVPCGKCGFCLQNRKRDWQFRLDNEMKYAITAYFLTLTYSDDYVPVKNGQDVLDKEDLQKFFKRLRKRHSKHSRTQIRYYAVGEYGTEKKRPHYHVLLFNAFQQDVEHAWPAGFVHFEPMEMSNVGYTVGYVSSIDNESVARGVPKQFSIMSRRPAIGFMYLKTHVRWHADAKRNYSQVNGVRGRLPRYYKTKIFDKSELESIKQKALDDWERSYQLRYIEYKNKNYSDPVAYVSEIERNQEKLIYQNILSTKKKI